MFEKFKIFNKKLDLKYLGYSRVETYSNENLIEKLINKGILREFEYHADLLKIDIFKKTIFENLEVMIIVSEDLILYLLMVSNFVIFKKTYLTFQKTIKDKKNNIELNLKYIEKYIQYYSNFNLKHLLEVGKYKSYLLQKNQSYNIVDNSDFRVEKHKYSKELYALINYYDTVTGTFKVNNFIYDCCEDKRIPLNSLFSDIDLEIDGRLNAYWLNDVYNDDIEKEHRRHILEININYKNSIYIYCEECLVNNINFVIFKNENNKDMRNLQVQDIVDDNDFEKILIKKDFIIDDQNFFLHIMRNRKEFLKNQEIKKVILIEIVKECLSLKDREEFGFKLSGRLDDEEMLVIKTLFY